MSQMAYKIQSLNVFFNYFRSIGKLTEHEGSHKLNRRHTSMARLEEDMLRVPIALALVKLLQKLPGDILKHQLPG